MKIALVIPARYASTRLPGKPLVSIAGRSLIERVWRIASAVPRIEQVVVATDDERIQAAVTAFGGLAVMTPEDCRNGTERVLAALSSLPASVEAVINFQGDAVLTPPWIIESLAEALAAGGSNTIFTPAVELGKQEYLRLSEEKAGGSSSGTLVVFDKNRRALYFSKRLIPCIRDNAQLADPTGVFQHVGMYGYSRETLEAYLQLPTTKLEQYEGLEQLRALEHGLPVQIVPVEYRGRTHASVDNPEDIAIVESIIEREGELVG